MFDTTLWCTSHTDVHADGNSHKHAHGNAHKDTDVYAGGNSHNHAHGNAHKDADVYAGGNSHKHAHGNAHKDTDVYAGGNSHNHAHGNADIYTNGHCDSDERAYHNQHTNHHQDASGHAYADGDRHVFGQGVVLANGVAAIRERSEPADCNTLPTSACRRLWDQRCPARVTNAKRAQLSIVGGASGDHAKSLATLLTRQGHQMGRKLAILPRFFPFDAPPFWPIIRVILVFGLP
jgi:hypothetical protein